MPGYRRNLKNLQFWPESLGAVLEYWYIERGLLQLKWNFEFTSYTSLRSVHILNRRAGNKAKMKTTLESAHYGQEIIYKCFVFEQVSLPIQNDVCISQKLIKLKYWLNNI